MRRRRFLPAIGARAILVASTRANRTPALATNRRWNRGPARGLIRALARIHTRPRAARLAQRRAFGLTRMLARGLAPDRGGRPAGGLTRTRGRRPGAGLVWDLIRTRSRQLTLAGQAMEIRSLRAG